MDGEAEERPSRTPCARSEGGRHGGTGRDADEESARKKRGPESIAQTAAKEATGGAASKGGRRRKVKEAGEPLTQPPPVTTECPTAVSRAVQNVRDG